MLEDAQGIRAVKAALDSPVILQADLDRQPLAQFAGVVCLLPGNGDPYDINMITLSDESRGPHP